MSRSIVVVVSAHHTSSNTCLNIPAIVSIIQGVRNSTSNQHQYLLTLKYCHHHLLLTLLEKNVLNPTKLDWTALLCM